LNGDHGIDVLYAPGQRIIGNSVYGNVTAGINVEGSSFNCTVANNISVDNAVNSPRTDGNIRVDSDSFTGTTIDYDLVFQTDPTQYTLVWGAIKCTSLSDFIARTGMENNGKEGDPLWRAPYDGDFHLTAGSPAIDSANSGVSGAPDVDIESLPRVDDPDTPNTGAGPRAFDDLGAYEYQPTCRHHPPGQ
jgi:hypothetical protein